MAILKRSDQFKSITERWRSLDLFTDRNEAVRLFLSYLNDEPAKERKPSRVAPLLLSCSELTTYLILTYALQLDLLQEKRDAQERRWLLALELHSYFIRKLLKKPSFSSSSIKLSSKSCSMAASVIERPSR